MLYFAYGSNLDLIQMRLRCPDVRYVGKARLDAYRLCFPRWSRIRESAVASFVPAVGEKVWGVLYELGDADLARLDQREGYDRRRQAADNVRNRVTVAVTRPAGEKSRAAVYIATPSANAGQPSSQYLAYLLQLAEACALPAEYRAMLATVKTAQMAA